MFGQITITFTSDRKKSGTLVLRDPKGVTLFSCRCLGRSVGHKTNATRDPLKYRGDTPVGRYALTSVSHLPFSKIGFGSVCVTLDPDNFYDSQARRAELGGRNGLAIHGGRGDAILKSTHGCVRLLDRDMADLVRIAGKLRFTVLIEQN